MTSSLVKIVGLDLSLTSTGIAVIRTVGQRGGDVKVETFRVRSTPVGKSIHQRMATLTHEVMEYAADADHVTMEGPAYLAGGNSASALTGFWWLVRHELWRNSKAEVTVVPPPTLKKYAAGMGNASKDEVLAAVIRRYPMAEVHGNDEADALALAAMTVDKLGLPLVTVPVHHRVALDKWPYEGKSGAKAKSK